MGRIVQENWSKKMKQKITAKNIWRQYNVQPIYAKRLWSSGITHLLLLYFTLPHKISILVQVLTIAIGIPIWVSTNIMEPLPIISCGITILIVTILVNILLNLRIVRSAPLSSIEMHYAIDISPGGYATKSKDIIYVCTNAYFGVQYILKVPEKMYAKHQGIIHARLAIYIT